MSLNHFVFKTMCFELLSNNFIQIIFPSNDLKFGMFIYYACVDFQNKFKHEFSFESKVWERK